MREYHKIEGLYARDPITKKLNPNFYRDPYVEYLKNNEWEFTEKVDGTNIRVIWDGYRIEFKGRTDKADIPAPLLEYLEFTFGGEANEQIFEQHFGNKQVTLYGEGYGGKIQAVGKDYLPSPEFILFDISINDIWLSRPVVEMISTYFGIKIVPVVLRGTIDDAVAYVKRYPKSTIGSCEMEGIVGRPTLELCARDGKRVIVKIKARDMRELEERGKSK